MLFQSCRNPSKMSYTEVPMPDDEISSGNQPNIDHLLLTRLKSLKDREEVWQAECSCCIFIYVFYNYSAISLCIAIYYTLFLNLLCGFLIPLEGFKAEIFCLVKLFPKAKIVMYFWK